MLALVWPAAYLRKRYAATGVDQRKLAKGVMRDARGVGERQRLCDSSLMVTTPPVFILGREGDCDGIGRKGSSG